MSNIMSGSAKQPGAQKSKKTRGFSRFGAAWAPRKQEKPEVPEIESDRILKLLMEELSPSKAAALTSKITGLQKKLLYNRALESQTKKRNN